MKRPNFFIIGAPKCGTTSLATWLNEHPRIYMSPVKEPHFFDTDSSYFYVRSLDRYEALFDKAGAEHAAVGEASVWYLYSRDAVPAIIEYVPHARLIVCIRNPVDMAYSLHGQLLLSRHEDEPDFAQAWQLQKARLRGHCIPRRCTEPLHLAYARTCALGTQLERLYEVAGCDRVLPILLDDLMNDPRKEYLKILKHLDVEDDGRTVFPILNAAVEQRFNSLVNILLFLGGVKRSLDIQWSMGLLDTIDRLNLRRSRRPPLSTNMRRKLQYHFEPEIRKLGQLLGRDLKGWLRQ